MYKVKPTSCHDPQIIKGIFTDFFDRAIRSCDDKFLQEELNFYWKCLSKMDTTKNN